MVTKEEVEEIAKETLRFPEPRRKWESADKEARIRSLFGASSEAVAELWNRIKTKGTIERGAKVQHLLWALALLKVCSTEEVHCAIVGWPATKTFGKWSWYFVKKIASLKDDVIKLDYRFKGLPKVVETNCFMSVDCADCPTFEPWPWNKKWFSKKTNGPALKCEVGVAIATGDIVWISGPHRASKHDVSIFKKHLAKELAVDEAVEGDKI